MTKCVIVMGWTRKDDNSTGKDHVTEERKLYSCLETEEYAEGKCKDLGVKKECMQSKEVINVWKMLVLPPERVDGEGR